MDESDALLDQGGGKGGLAGSKRGALVLSQPQRRKDIPLLK